ncbi:sigma 54-interacting transcriptional regulator [Anaeromyxobacter oryzisoli]|uniref:sigma 54-interacting transcriptional regulator n=1 Tax=Anaeromyxobacter oryzisoli TaxID=2925408 RepID=UPI001F57F5A6|nr:sigma 54-interacting transcriptional regulator [Anaeromyxobacter sp. SG63]
MDAGQASGALEALHAIGRILSYATDLSKALTQVLLVLRSHAGLANGTVALQDGVTGDVFIEAAPEMLDAERIQGRLRPGEGIIGRVFRTGVAVAIPDLADEPVFLNRTGSWRDLREDPRALYAVPLRDGRMTLGVLTAERRWALGSFSFDRDLKLLGVVAEMLAARIRLAQRDAPAARDEDEAPRRPPPDQPLRGVIGGSAPWRAVLDVVARVAPSRATVLLRGESGTGKEVLARALHDLGPRAARPFVAVNCAALPEALLESELFGHERGAFTGANQARPGRFELADGGTLFLDEVSEMPLAAQVKLLRAIQERQFERVGGRRTLTVDVRLVAATNRDLEEEIRRGAFRLDLYHRLQVVEIALPPLRERRDDIPPLARHFLAELEREHGRRLALAPDAIDRLRALPWPGNVRQLRNALERLVVSSPRDEVTAADLSFLEDAAPPPARPAVAPVAPAAAMVEPIAPPRTQPTERERIAAALSRTGHVQAGAARLLGMTVRQLRYRIVKYGIAVQRI